MTALATRPPPAVTVVTGASGWLGVSFVRAVAAEHGRWARPGRVRALVRNRVEAERVRGLGERVDPVVGDVTEPSSLAPLFADADGELDVVHAAGIIHPRRLDELFEVNVAGTRAVLAAAAASGARRVVHVSSNSPFGTNPHPDDRFRQHEPYAPYYGYGRSKMEGELAVFDAVDAGLDAVIVRPPWFYGPDQPARQTTFFRMIRAGRFPVIGDGGQRRSMVYVDNLADGVALAELVPTEPGSGWWVADERPYTVAEIVDTVGAALADEGLTVRPGRTRLPDVAARLAERADWVIQRAGRYHQRIHVLGEMNKNIACDISATRRDLGYEPRVGLREGMRRSIRWCLDRGIEL